FQPSGQQPALVTMARDGSSVKQVVVLSIGFTYTSPRWSPDDSAIAFQQASDRGFDVRVEVVAASGGEPQEVTPKRWVGGFCWLGGRSVSVYSSSHGSTLLYPPVFNLRRIGRAGTDDRQLTFGDQSYVDPDLHHSGRLTATRVRSQSDIWRFPTTGSPAKNTRGATRVTRQTGHVQTPTVSPDGTEIAYLSDNGGHGNLWITKTDGSNTRQVTFEQDPETSLGVPKWSPAGDLIVFLMTHGGMSALWTMAPDGRGLSQLVAPAWWPSWSGDGRSLYYQSQGE